MTGNEEHVRTPAPPSETETSVRYGRFPRISAAGTFSGASLMGLTSEPATNASPAQCSQFARVIARVYADRHRAKLERRPAA
jgi:hypothetical protein